MSNSIKYTKGDLIEVFRKESIFDNIIGKYERTSKIPAIVVSSRTVSTWVMDRPVSIRDRDRYTIIAEGKICNIDKDIICRKLSMEKK